jgi:hypothetical protein
VAVRKNGSKAAKICARASAAITGGVAAFQSPTGAIGVANVQNSRTVWIMMTSIKSEANTPKGLVNRIARNAYFPRCANAAATNQTPCLF